MLVHSFSAVRKNGECQFIGTTVQSGLWILYEKQPKQIYGVNLNIERSHQFGRQLKYVVN